MLTKTKAIVLSSMKYGDKKVFVDLFTQDFGRITIANSVAAKSKKRGANNLFQPLNILEIEFDYNPRKEIQTVSEARIDYPCSSIPFDPFKISISLFIAEFLKYALQNEQKNELLFNYVEQSIQWLDNTKSGFANFHIVFMIKLSHFVGFYPNAEEYRPGCMFDLKDGSFTSIIPTHKQVIRPQEAAIIPLLLRLNYATMHLLKLSRTARNQCTDSILEYYKLHVPGFPDLKSFSVMKELFI